MFGKLRRLVLGEPSPPAPTSSEPMPPKVVIWPEEALATWPYSLHGVRLGATRQGVETILTEELRKPTERYWVWGEHDMNSILFEGDRVREIWATSLERDGKVILRQGDPGDSLIILGGSTRTFGFMASTERHFIYDMPPFLLDVTVTTEAAIGSPEHQMIFGSKQVVDRVFHIGLKLEES